jgi:branched-subunit amino acid transport protein|tara:strand:+ start:312 stop:623 length:312 start_codon:yes stop_codon:yes gene_type:complete
MNWLSIFIAGVITYFCRFSMVTFIKSEMLNEKTRLILSYVPSAVFPAIIFPAIFLNETGILVNINDPKIIGATIAIIVGYFSKNVIATILTGLISYWIIILLM